MLKEYEGQESFFGSTTPLSVETGYAIVLGFGCFFSVFTVLVVVIDKRYNKTVYTSEFFHTAGRLVKTGLTASVIVCQWTWAATLLQSSNVAWLYGVSGPFWYASGATIQILLFGILANELKRKARTCHTVCELVLYRWGRTAHKTFLFFCLLTNVIVTAMLLLGGAATMNALSGMNTDLASFLIPWGIVLYTAIGGLHATFVASYIHTTVIFVILVACVYAVYVKNTSTDRVWEGLTLVSAYTQQECEAIFSSGGTTFFEPGAFSCGPVVDNSEGSYLTMWSLGGFQFGIINIVGNFGTVFVDQSYWQSAIAVEAGSAHRGFFLAGLAWFAIPFSLATAFGLEAVSLQLPISAAEAGAGLVPPAVATHFFGSTGAVLISIMLFMGISSTGSAESMAVSSLFAYDIYRVYWNPKATGPQILRCSQSVVVVFGLVMGGLSVALHYMELNLGWVYQFMGNVIGSAVVPLWNLLTWKDANAEGAIAGAWVGLCLALFAWILATYLESGEITVTTLGALRPNLAGNLVAIVSSGCIHFVWSKLKPQNFDFKVLNSIPLLEHDMRGLDSALYKAEILDAHRAWIRKWAWSTSIFLVVIWPLFSTAAGVFSKAFFSFWVLVSIAWAFVTCFIMVVIPVSQYADVFSRVSFYICGIDPDLVDG